MPPRRVLPVYRLSLSVHPHRPSCKKPRNHPSRRDDLFRGSTLLKGFTLSLYTFNARTSNPNTNKNAFPGSAHECTSSSRGREPLPAFAIPLWRPPSEKYSFRSQPFFISNKQNMQKKAICQQAFYPLGHPELFILWDTPRSPHSRLRPDWR